MQAKFDPGREVVAVHSQERGLAGKAGLQPRLGSQQIVLKCETETVEERSS